MQEYKHKNSVEIELPRSTPTGYENPLKKSERKRDTLLIFVGANIYGFLIRCLAVFVYSTLLVSIASMHITWIAYMLNVCFIIVDIAIIATILVNINNTYISVSLSVYLVLIIFGFCLGVYSNGTISGVG